jgi:hypothetical protein
MMRRLSAAVLLFSGVGIVGVALPSGASATSATKLSASTPAAAVSCGKTTSITKTGAGDTKYSFTLSNGLVETAVVPAASIDFATASPQRIKDLALPPRPRAGTAERASWDRLAAGTRTTTAPSASCIRSNLHATVYSDIWSGYKGTAASGRLYYGASASMTAPTWYLSSCDQESMTQWVGVSGPGFLVQAGLYATQFSGTLETEPFYEFVGGTWNVAVVVPDKHLPLYTPNARYFFSVRYVNRYAWGIVIQNLDTGVSFARNVGKPGDEGAPGATQYLQPDGAFISERLTYTLNNSNYATQYMNHSDVRFRDAKVYFDDGSSARMSIQRPQEIVLQGMVPVAHGYEKKRLSNTSDFNESTSSFTESWARCGILEFTGQPQ